ncbi:MAG: ectonucleotide pyrophosphatase/phosphodiesterase [Myxococcota bacterium]
MSSRAALLAALLWWTSAGAWAADSEAPLEPTVIVISLDGVRHDYLERASFPALGRMARQGARAEALVPVYPSSTFPGHVSLATGTYPDVHGIVDNVFWDPARGRFDYANDASWIEAEPLWAAAERQGVPAATFFWVGSETDWRGVGARHRRAPFDSGIGEAEKVRQILAWLALPAAERPRLILSWWHGADRVGHSHGPDHPAVVESLSEQDAHLARLLAALDARNAWPHTTLLVVSDHGMTTAEHTIPLGETLSSAGVEARIETGAAVAHLFFEETDAVARAEAALEGLAGATVHRRAAFPRALRLTHPRRSGDLIVQATPPYTFRRGGLLATVGDLLGRRRGLHGYRASEPDMQGILLALGRGVAPGETLGPAAMIDVAATVSALLGIDPPAQSEGAPIPGIGPPLAQTSTPDPGSETGAAQRLR